MQFILYKETLHITYNYSTVKSTTAITSVAAAEGVVAAAAVVVVESYQTHP